MLLPTMLSIKVSLVTCIRFGVSYSSKLSALKNTFKGSKGPSIGVVVRKKFYFALGISYFTINCVVSFREG